MWPVDGLGLLLYGSEVGPGCFKEDMEGLDSSHLKSPLHSGQRTTGKPPGLSGGKASTMISSTHSVWLHERQW